MLVVEADVQIAMLDPWHRHVVPDEMRGGFAHANDAEGAPTRSNGMYSPSPVAVAEIVSL